jgi:hypothetical protein
MLRSALHGQGQHSARWHAMGGRGSLRVRQLVTHNRFGYRLPDLNGQPSTDPRKVFLPALNDRVSTPGVSR